MMIAIFVTGFMLGVLSIIGLLALTAQDEPAGCLVIGGTMALIALAIVGALMFI